MSKLISIRELVECGTVPWCSKTIRRKIANEGFPATMISGRYYFDLAKIEIWKKRHELKAS